MQIDLLFIMDDAGRNFSIAKKIQDSMICLRYGQKKGNFSYWWIVFIEGSKLQLNVKRYIFPNFNVFFNFNVII